MFPEKRILIAALTIPIRRFLYKGSKEEEYLDSNKIRDLLSPPV